jgi:mannose-6-phosphate isomerase
MADPTSTPLTRIYEEDRPWGRFRQFAHNEVCTVKIITVAAGGILSLQRHQTRDELWVVIDPGLRIEVGDVVAEPVAGEEFFIPRGTVHRLSSAGPAGRILEVAFGVFDEQDIERLQDVYDRC